MTDSTVHNLTDIVTAGGVLASDLLYAVRPGSPDADYRVNAGALAALAAPFNPATHAIVAKGGIVPHAGSFSSAYTRAERRSVATIGGQPVKSLRLVFWNGYVTHGEHNGPNAITIEAGLENPGATQTVMFTFGGEPNITLAPGAKAWSDPIYPAQFGLSVFPAGWQPFVRTGAILGAAGQCYVYPDYDYYQAPSSGIHAVGSTSVTSQIANTGALVNPASGYDTSGTQNIYAMGPHAIIGEWAGAPDASLFISGDSIALGFGDNTDSGAAGGGFIVEGTRSVNGRTVPQVMTAKGGEYASDWASGHAFRTWLMQFCTHYIDNFGTNDIALGSASASTVLTNKQTIWTAFRANGKAPAHVANIGLIPRAGSSDNWETTTHQTPVTGYNTGGVRDTVNTNVLSIVGTASGPDEQIVINAGYLQDSTTTYAWVVNGTALYATADGTHPNAQGNIIATPVVTAAAQYWSVAASTMAVQASAGTSAAPLALTASKSGLVLTNKGDAAETYNDLPAAVPGLTFAFYCQNTNGIRAVANGSDIIRLGASASAAGGYVRSTAAGSYLSLACVVPGEWAATSSYGTWAAT